MLRDLVLADITVISHAGIFMTKTIIAVTNYLKLLKTNGSLVILKMTNG